MKFGRDSGEEVRSHNAFDAHATEYDEEEFVSFLLLLFDDDEEEEHGSMGHWNNDRQSLPSLLCASSSQQPCVMLYILCHVICCIFYIMITLYIQCHGI